MKRMLRIAAGIALVASITGCELLFSGKNLFAGLDGPDMDELKKATGSDLIDLLNESKGGESGGFGDTFLEKVKTEGSGPAIVANLALIYASGSTASPTSQAEAANLAADLLLGTTETGDVVNSIVGAVIGETNIAPETILSSVLQGTTAATNSTEFYQFMDNMIMVSDAYQNIGDSYTTNGELVPIDLADGQTAAVSIIFSTLVDIVDITAFDASYPGMTALTDDQKKSGGLFDEVISPMLNGDTADLTTAFGTGTAAETAFDNLMPVDSVPDDPDDPATIGLQIDPADSSFSALMFYSGASTLIEMIDQ